MTVVSQLVIEMAANTARLASDMNSAKGMVSGAMNEVTRVTNVAKTAFAALGVTVSAAAFVSLIKNSIEATASLHELSMQTGVSVEALSKFRDVGVTSGTTAEQVSGAMAKLAKNMAVANEDSKGTAQAIKALGLKFEDFRRLKPEDQMQAVAKAMDRVADGSGKTAVAMTLFGKSGAELLPFMKDLAVQGDLVATVTAEQAAQADEFTDNLALLKLSSQATTREFTNAMLPALAQGSKAFLSALTQAGGLRDQIKKLADDGSITRWTKQGIIGLTYIMDMLAGVKRVFQSVGEVIGASLAIIGSSVSALAAAAKKLIAGDFAGALAEVRTGMSQVKSITKDLGETLSDAWSAETIGQKIRARMSEIDALGKTAQAVKPKIDMRAEIDGNAAASKRAAKAHEEQLTALSIYTKKELELIEITAQRIELTGKSVAELQKQSDAAKAATEAQAELTKSIFDGLTDAIYRSAAEGENVFKSLAESLKGLFQNLILQPTIRAVMGPVSGAIGGLFSGSANAGAGGLGSMLGGLGSLFDMFGSGAAFGLNGIGNLGSTFSGGASMISGGISGGSLGSILAGVGTFAPYVAAIMAAISMGSASYGKGFTGNMPGFSMDNLTKYPLPMLAGFAGIKGADSIFTGLGMNKKWASLLSGSQLMSQMFGMADPKIKETGFDLTAADGGISGNAYAKLFYKGGWFRSNKWKTKTADMPNDASLALGLRSDAIFAEMSAYADALGLPVEALKTVTTTMRIEAGKTDEETAANIAAFFDKYREDLSASFSTVLEPFQQAGETLAETLQRLVGIQAMSEQLNQFGGVFSRIATLSVDAREELIGFAGGIEALLEKTRSFVSAYYSEGEQAAIAAKQIRDALGAMGIGANVSSKSDFRALVEGLDVSSTEGRKQLDALLSIAQTFAPVADYLGKAGGTLASLADQAPQSQILQSMFDAGQVQGEAAQRTADGIDRVNDAIASQTDATVSGLEALRAEVAALNAAVTAGLASNARSITGAIEELA